MLVRQLLECIRLPSLLILMILCNKTRRRDGMVRRQYEGGELEEPGEPGSKGQQGEGIHRYRMRQNLVAFGDDYWIENALGSRVFFVDGKAYRLREHLGFQDMQGNELAA